ncbi:unnamed protein product [Caenorhabditis angaria]|uniref:Uncharacterized protein n=1 Tax=Caenorhabditis angaria TaxID=860376 RepID=A0A9P1J0N5_9PELO|nr:unnamed protein product [Caenorhabditis angaria]
MASNRSNSRAFNEEDPAWKHYWSETCLEVIFIMTRFREHLELPEFTHLEFEDELMKEHKNYGADEMYVYRSLLLTQMLEVLLKKALKKDATTELDALLILFMNRHIEQHPFKDLNTLDIHCVPTGVKLWIYLQLLNYHCTTTDSQANDSFFQWRIPDFLRAKEFHLQDGTKLFYMHDLRLFKQHPASEFAKRKSGISEEHLEKEVWKDIYLDVHRGTHYECLANDHDSWMAYIKSLGPENKKQATEMRSVYRIFVKDNFQRLFNSWAHQRANRAKLHNLLDIEKRRSLGLFRTSSRIQNKRLLEGATSEESKTGGEEKQEAKVLSRDERMLKREEHKEFMRDLNLQVEIPKTQNSKDFDSPQNLSPISLKEVDVENFRLTNPPISPQRDTFEQNNINDKFGVPEETIEAVVASLTALPNLESTSQTIDPTTLGQISPKSRKRKFDARMTVEAYLAATLPPTLKPKMKSFTKRSRLNTSSIPCEPSSSGTAILACPSDWNPTVKPTKPPIKRSATQKSQNHPEMMNRQLAVRVFRYFYNEIFVSWATFYKVQTMPPDLCAFFDGLPRDERKNE